MGEPTTVLIGGVACTVFGLVNKNEKSGSEEGFPFIYCLHGRLGTQEDVGEIAERISALGSGCVAVTFDNPNHGKRKINDVENNSWPKNKTHSMDMYAQIIETIQEVSLMIDFLPNKIGIKCKSVGVIGISQGGHATLIALTQDPRIDVCVSLISSADYILNMQIRYENLLARAKKKGWDDPEPFNVLVPEDFQKITVPRYDPICNVDSLCKGFRPLLIINGADDKLVPIQCNLKLMDKIKPLYEIAGHASRLKHVILEGVKHEVPEIMVETSLKWLDQHLNAYKASRI